MNKLYTLRFAEVFYVTFCNFYLWILPIWAWLDIVFVCVWVAMFSPDRL